MTSQNATDPVNIAAVASQLLIGAQGLQMTRFATAAAGTVYVYAIFLTFDEEVEYFWSTLKPTFPNLLYIINRYVCLGFFLNLVYDMSGFHGDFTRAYCTKCTGVIGLTLAHISWTGIMTVRVTALWGSHPRLVYFLWALWAGIVSVVGVFSYLSYKSVIETMTYNTFMRVCATDHNPKVMIASPLPPTLYELLLTILTVVKTYKFVNATKVSSPPILHVLARDGVIYFVLSSVVSLSNMLSWHLLPPELSGFMLYIYWALLSTCTSYLTLNLRRAYYHGRANETEQISSNGCDATITFARMPPNPPNTRITNEREFESREECDASTIGDGEQAYGNVQHGNIRYPRRAAPRERFTSSSSVWIVQDTRPNSRNAQDLLPSSPQSNTANNGTGRSSAAGRSTGNNGSSSPGSSGSGNLTGLKAACAFIMGDGEFFPDPSNLPANNAGGDEEGGSLYSGKAKKRDRKEKDLEKWGSREDSRDVLVDAIPLSKLVQSKSR